MSVLKSIVIFTSPVFALSGWAFSAMSRPYDDVLVAVSLAMIMVGTASGILYFARSNVSSKSGVSEGFYYLCYFLSMLTFVVALLGRAFRIF